VSSGHQYGREHAQGYSGQTKKSEHDVTTTTPGIHDAIPCLGTDRSGSA